MHDDVEDGVIKHKWRLIRNKKDKGNELYDFLVDRDTSESLASDKEGIILPLLDSYTKWYGEISANSEPFPPFVVNHEKESELTLYSHSWIGENMSPWHQRHVRKADEGSRVHSIRFDHPGRYRVELRRWPREDGSAIDSKCKTGDCKTLSPAKASVKIGGLDTKLADIQPGDTSVSFEMDVNNTEPTTITTAFLDAEGNVICGAYCTYIKALAK